MNINQKEKVEKEQLASHYSNYWEYGITLGVAGGTQHPTGRQRAWPKNTRIA